MSHEISISELKDELAEIHQRAIDYFQREAGFLEDKQEYEMFRIQRDYWANIAPEARDVGEAIGRNVIEAMGKIAAAVRQSPLLDEADQREITVSAKTMRAALYFREYDYSEAEVLHDEGTVLGIRRAQQFERNVYVDSARRLFQKAYDSVSRILDLATPGTNSLASAISQTERAVSKYRPNTAFIMMWMENDHPELDDLRDTIKDAFEAFGIRAVRSDEIEHEDVITKRILDEIATCEFLIADLTGARPSVYYEVGFAHALQKRVILYRKKGTSLHFDLAVHNCPEYENLGDLKVKLRKRLQQLTNRSPGS